jgi:hypothetical protein
MTLNSIGKNPCGPLAGNRDRDSRPCEGTSQASATQPVVNARAASRLCRGADARLAHSKCAMRQPASKLKQDCCVMISGSTGHRLRLLQLRRLAGRSIPMMGIDRFKLFSPTLLILFVLLGMPVAAHSDALEDSARSLADKIAAVVTARGDMACKIRNISTLELDDVIRIDHALMAELQGRCVRTRPNGSEAASVVVNLSENMKGFLWTAEIHQANTNQEVLQIVPFSSRSSAKALPAILKSERFWDGPQQILDAGLMAASNGDQLVILLTPDAVFIQNMSRHSENKIDIPLGIPSSTLRDPEAALYLNAGNIITAGDGQRYCTVSLETLILVKCWDTEGIGGRGLMPPFLVGLFAPAPMSCTKNIGSPWFATGPGDDAQSDTLWLEVHHDLGTMVTSNYVNFPGPVLAIQEARNDASNTIIVRNVHTGNYEAYRVSISCVR